MIKKYLFGRKDSKIVIAQFPNLPLIGWFVFLLISKIFSEESSLKLLSSYISTGFLVVWATLEIFKGANLFRRILGFLILAFVLKNIFF